jgi:cellulose synthase/poly-beta-1,6-N-acetylglucosamine synthase-like glycosyltransferase
MKFLKALTLCIGSKMEHNNIKVGVLIPTYNRRAYLEKAFNSVFEQTYDNYELIVIDMDRMMEPHYSWRTFTIRESAML